MPDLSAHVLTTDRDQLIERHRTYVRALAVHAIKTLPAHVDLQELIAYGELGLVEAAERFDARRGFAFSTFAHYRIKGAIYDGLRQMGYFSRAAQRLGKFAANANDLLQSAADDAQATHDLAPALDDEIGEVQNLIDALIPAFLLSLDSDTMPEIADSAGESAFEQVAHNEIVGLLHLALTDLTDDEQNLLRALYFKHTPTTELAKQMGVTKSWVSRLHAKAIKRLRAALETHGVLAEYDG